MTDPIDLLAVLGVILTAMRVGLHLTTRTPAPLAASPEHAARRAALGALERLADR